MPPAGGGALQVGGPVGELHPSAAVVHRPPDGGARLAVVGELVPDVVGGGGAGEQRPVRPGDQLVQRRRGVAAPAPAACHPQPCLPWCGLSSPLRRFAATGATMPWTESGLVGVGPRLLHRLRQWATGLRAGRRGRHRAEGAGADQRRQPICATAVCRPGRRLAEEGGGHAAGSGRSSSRAVGRRRRGVPRRPRRGLVELSHARTSARPQSGGPREVEQGIQRAARHPHGFAAPSGVPPVAW